MSLLPIVTYNDPVLREKTLTAEQNTPELQKLIDNMFETMYNSDGVGLAAPQVGRLVRLFVVDADAITEDLDEEDRGPLVFINPEIIFKSENTVKMEEGCLSIPELRDDVTRPAGIVIQYLDRDFSPQKLNASGWLSRIIQHEYDHLDGILFIDHVSAFRRRLHKSLLARIDNGELEIPYPVVPKNLNQD